jgi:dTDP-4-amino-4,6-dideoxygalactose transaminase
MINQSSHLPAGQQNDAAEPARPTAQMAARRVPYVDFLAQFEEERTEILAIVEDVFTVGRFVEGDRITQLERTIAAFAGVDEAVALGSGTDALVLGMRALGIGPGDEVITVPNSFIATVASVVLAGARPVLVDVGEDMNIDPALIERAITARTRAIMPVHLTGRTANMSTVCEIADRRGLLVIEDAAQAFGARYRGRMAGTWGRIGCCSAHPLKNLNAAGDAGFLLTNDGEVAERVRRLRSHGLINRNESLEWGQNARMDVLQAAILMYRLRKLNDNNERRRHNADLYRNLIKSQQVRMPICRAHEYNIFHTFIVDVPNRDALKEHLRRHGVDTVIHYPIPVHLQEAAASLGYRRGDFPVTERQAASILSLPIHPYLSEQDIDYVASVIDQFYG